jgi:DNA-binding CsgD family transcriptional regulator
VARVSGVRNCSTVDTLDDLTAQEAQVARLACDGRINPEIAAQLFIGPRNGHLRKTFTKPGISSRKQFGGRSRRQARSSDGVSQSLQVHAPEGKPDCGDEDDEPLEGPFMLMWHRRGPPGPRAKEKATT